MTKPKCKIDGCDIVSLNLGWCSKHYQRWRKHGDPNAPGSIAGKPAEYLRDVVLSHSSEECLIWPFARGKNGYAVLRIDGKAANVHRRVCEAENGPPPSDKPHALHSCGNGAGGCVNRHHLRWGTHKENMADKIIHGTHSRGERRPLAKLTREDVRAIRAARNVRTQADLADLFGVAPSTICEIQTGKRWAWLPTAT